MESKTNILAEAEKIKIEIIRWRREIHSWPELGGQETQTQALVIRALEEMGIEYRTAAETGVLGLIRGQGSKTVALRADLDALPVQEETGLPFASQRPGLMHACGHDAHTAMLLGAAKVLNGMAHELPGNVRLIFQPSEEHHPGGALPLIQEGALQDPHVDMVFGLHVEPLLPKGVLGIKEGAAMAAADTFTLKVIGRGGHGSAPHMTIDPIVLASQVVLGLQTISSRRVDPRDPVVLTIGAIHGGEVNNIIPAEVTLKGTVRTLSPGLRSRMPELIEAVVGGITRGSGGDYQLDYRMGYPPLVNDPNAVGVMRTAARKILGAQGVKDIRRSVMGAEDFSYYAQKVPACFAFLGMGDKETPPVPWHSPKFIVDEEVLPLGTAVLAESALEYLTQW